jgi:ferredoxin
MKLHIDADRCTGHGRCYTLAPKLLAEDDEGFVSVRGQSIDVPRDLEPAALVARGACPEGAITLTKPN